MGDAIRSMIGESRRNAGKAVGDENCDELIYELCSPGGEDLPGGGAAEAVAKP